MALMGGVNYDVWGETFGSTSDGYLGNKSTSITLSDGGTVNYVFSQTTAATQVWQGFILVANTTSGTELVKLRQDNWELVSGGRDGIMQHTISDVNTVMNGATVDMTVTYSSGTFTMSSTIYGSDNGEYTYGYTKTIDGAPSSIVVYLSNDHAKLLIGKTVVTKGTITTTTYDFTSWVTESTAISLSETSAGYAYRYDTYLPSNFNSALYFNSNFGFRNSNATLETTGLNQSKDNFLVIRNLTAGDKLIYTFTSSVNIIHNQSGNTPSSSSFTLDGTELEGGNSVALVSGQTYYDFRDARVAVRPVSSGGAVFSSITVKHNTSANYATLFALWKTAVANDNNELYTEGKSTFETAISAAKAILDADEAPNDDYAAAIIALREANELFVANNTHETSYRVSSSSVMNDGTNVKSVYGITATYHGSWTWTSDRNGNAQAATDPIESANLTNNIPTAGEYIELRPTVDGTLTLKFAWYNGSTYRVVDGSNGHFVFNFKCSRNEYSAYETVGSLLAGKTYYVYKVTGNYGYQFGGFTFTPEANTRTSYAANNGEIIKGGSVISDVAGITLTYGGTSDETWGVQVANNTERGWKNGSAATVTNNVPSAGTYLIFNPIVNGKLTMSWYAFGSGSIILSDGTTTESIGATSGNGTKTSYFSTVLSGGTTYYVYCSSIKSYVNGFWGFTFTPTPATVSATIGSTGFATFSSEYPLDFSATTTKAYAASLTGDNTVLLSPVTAVPANTGLLLKGATEDIPVKAGFGAAAPATNLLKASEDADIAASVEGTYHYVLANGSKGVGFYNLAAAKNIGTGKAYLETTTPLAAASEARVAWIFADDAETTGIDSMNIVPCAKNKEIFNLNGQRVDNPTRGLYIVNGKKVIIK